MRRGFAATRFTLGSVLGIAGLGFMGRSAWPFQLSPFGGGLILLIVGAVIALGVIAAPRHRS